MNTKDIIKCLEKRCKDCNINIKRLNKTEETDEDEGKFVAGYDSDNNEIILCVKGKTKVWEAVFLAHEFSHSLWEKNYVYKNTKPLKYKEYDTNTFFIELQVEALTLKILQELKANRKIIDFCKKAVITNLKDYLT